MWWARRVSYMNIKSIITVPSAFILGVAAVAVLTTVMQAPASAHSDDKTHAETTAAKEDNKQSSTTYTYIAQPGDSYSVIARKAIQTYGAKNKVNLSQSRILYTETNLTQEAGSPQLLQGQKVEIKESTVKNWVDKAKALSNDQAAKWDVYTTGVNFNTNNVGEVSN
jgi:hypothetical protein